MARVGHFGFKYDRRFGQVQTYTDGTPVHEGDRVSHTQAPGGMLNPTTTEGTAEFAPWDDGGELFVKTTTSGFDRYFHMNGTIERRN